MASPRKTQPLPPSLAQSSSHDDDYLPVNQRVFKALRSAIINCTLPPGTPLSETDVSTMFEVSRQPVRESFIKLGEAGLVRVLPQRGTFVRKISAKEVLDARFIREAIETAVIRQAAQRITPETLSWLAHNLQLQTLACERKDMPEFLTLDDAFHAALATSIDCPKAWDNIEQLKAHMDRVRYLTLDHISPMQDLVVQHQQILTALSKHDADAASLAIQEHLGQLTETLTQVEAQHPDWFE
ncbi:GntR family transcriptional regulator [Amantichitinum ursilacus]|uniref:Putative HTH-type transcriptional regulator YdfH n=1 Tax=Amantichitinum ursilacus TaxID=857265 RepID=A0A0N0XJ46_9NEIS|nr:GntR family transcriptional regulator [Amantichitinum ursilacus]KPC50773.1 putative HTH-type transcriptional regulator YdfH [Amantichitinum ursilacus]